MAGRSWATAASGSAWSTSIWVISPIGAFDLLAFVRWLQAGGVALEDVTTEVLLRFLAFCRQAKLQGQPGGNVHSIRDARSTGYAAATINRRLVAIAGLFEYLAMREPEAVNPVPRGSEPCRAGPSVGA